MPNKTKIHEAHTKVNEIREKYKKPVVVVVETPLENIVESGGEVKRITPEEYEQKASKEHFEKGGEVANTIIHQLGGMGKLKAMVGAYNFVDLKNGISFRLKGRKANYVKIILNSKDLYDVEIGRIAGEKYKVVGEHKDLHFDQIKHAIEQDTEMYLSLEKGGTISHPEVSERERNHFINYVLDFYGENGIYGKEFFPPKGITKEEVEKAVDTYLKETTSWGGGDTVDREKVRDIVLQERSENYPAHYGKGKNIDVFGYETKHFHHCPLAVSEFETAIAVISEETKKEDLKKVAELVDNILKIEEDAVHAKMVDSSGFDNAVVDAMSAAMYNYRAGMAINLFLFIPEHLKQIAVRLHKTYCCGGLMEKKYEEGGEIAFQNHEMLAVNLSSIKHHSSEIENLLGKDVEIPAWVVAKAERSATDLSDITHFIEAIEHEDPEHHNEEQKFEEGGEVKVDSGYANYLLNEIEKKYKEKFNDGWDVKTELAKGFNQNVKDRGEKRAIAGLEEIYTSYVPNSVKAEAYQVLRNNFEKHQEHHTDKGEYAKGGKVKVADIKAKGLAKRNRKKQGLSTSAKSINNDAIRQALPPGKRISENGNTYYEYRENRSDRHPKKYPMLEHGGQVTFSDKVKAIKEKLQGEPVPAKYKKEYGKKYTPKTAKAAATKIAGAMVKHEN